MEQSIMSIEARQAPCVIEQQIKHNTTLINRISETLREHNPRFLFLIGRGSSDHAGVFAKYLFEVELGLAVSSAAPSVSGVFDKTLNLQGAVALVISQSGRSPDILKQTESAKKGGAFTIALVNDENSPLAQIADAVIPLRAGEEKAVAATKSYLATLSAIVHLCASWNQDQALLTGLELLPDALRSEVEGNAQLTTLDLVNVRNAVVLGRGFGYAIGREIALKLKEVLGIHAESFSSAEFIHGPVTLVENKLKIIDLHVDDETGQYHQEAANDIQQRGAEITKMHCESNILHRRLLPFLVLQRFYIDVEKIAVDRGLNPDTPPGLNKVTKTL
jgi:glucosamine--fructose-6-phosphate aminotransferase (isomerizing)